MATSPKSTSASRPGRCSCGMNALAGSRPTSTRISRRRVATYSRTIQYDTTPAPSCSSSSRSKIRFAVCRCFRGASTSERSQSSITTRYASSREPRLDGCFLSFGHADSSAAVTVRKPTPCLRYSARLDIPDRASRRIAAYRSTRERGCVIGGTPDVSTPWARLLAPGHRPGTVTACDHSPESLALPRCLVMCCAGLRWAVLSRPGVRGTTDDGADEQRVGQVESH